MVAALITSSTLTFLFDQLTIDQSRLDTVFDVHHRHQVADVVLRDFAHAPRTHVVEVDEHRRCAALLIESGRRILDLITGDDDVAIEQNRAAVLTTVIQTGIERYVAILCSHPVGGRAVYQAVFERCGGAEDVLGARGVLHTRQLHHDALQALLLYHGFGYAEFIDTVAQGHDVLLQRAATLLPARPAR